MKKIVFALLFILASCTTYQNDISPTQNYRLKGQENVTRISGNLTSAYEPWLGQPIERILNVYFDGNLVLRGNLPVSATGELTGGYNGKEVLALCSSEVVSTTWRAVRCTILYDNEKTVTLTF